MKKTAVFISCALILTVVTESALAAIGCTLSNPARDLKTLYPGMTSYREDVKELTKFPNGQELYASLKERLGDDLDPVYESYETPYTLYSVFQGQGLIGYVHGVNVAGRGGVIQVFSAFDPATAAVTNFFFQRLESPGGRLLRSKETRQQFIGLSLADFYKHDYFKIKDPGNAADKVAQLKAPADLPEIAKPDWEVTLRGMRKNLILMDFFVFEQRHEPFYKRAKEAL